MSTDLRCIVPGCDRGPVRGLFRCTFHFVRRETTQPAPSRPGITFTKIATPTFTKTELELVESALMTEKYRIELEIAAMGQRAGSARQQKRADNEAVLARIRSIIADLDC